MKSRPLPTYTATVSTTDPSKPNACTKWRSRVASRCRRRPNLLEPLLGAAA